MYTRPIHPHQKKKKRAAIADPSDMVAKALLTNVSIILPELVYLQKMDQNPHHGLFTNIPI
jgi:hypothetical protein